MAGNPDTKINNLPIAIAYCTYSKLLRRLIKHEVAFVACIVLQAPLQFEFHEAAIHLLMSGGTSRSQRFSRSYHLRKVFRVKGKIDDLLDDALSHKQVFLLFENEDDISPEVRAAADKVHVFGQIAPSLMTAAIYHVTGEKISEQDAAFVATAPWRIAAMSFRQGRSTARAIERLRFWDRLQPFPGNLGAAPPSDASPHAQTVPKLETLYGYGEARQWGLQFKKDLADVQSGLIGWDDIDTGLLLSGPPGCGKTMFAHALAATCDIPLYSVSFAKWQAGGHLGDYLREMQKTFADAQANAPSLVFVDEVDSHVRRSNGFINDDYMRLATNGFLECVDGSKRRAGVIVIGATNMPEVLDEALLRPGRFGKHIKIELPNADERMLIIAQYLSVAASAVDDRNVRLATEGMSGDDLRDLALRARRHARNARKPVDVSDVLSELPQIVPLPNDRLWINAIHEAGHALVAHALGREVEEITIEDILIKRSGSQVGGTVKVKVPGFSRRSETYYLDEIAIFLAGMAAENEVFGSHDDAVGGMPNSDLVIATHKATLIVAYYGMAGTLLSEVDGGPDAAAALRRNNPIIWRLVNEVLQRQLDRVKAVIGDNRDLLEHVAAGLMTSRRMNGDKLRQLVEEFDVTRAADPRTEPSARESRP